MSEIQQSPKCLDPAVLAKVFGISGRCLGISHLPQGHIHHSWRSTWETSEGEQRQFIHQQLNTVVFPNPELVMQNLVNGIEVLQSSLAILPLEPGEQFLSLRLTSQHQPFFSQDGTDGTREIWRTFDFIRDTISYDITPSVPVAFAAGKLASLFTARMSIAPVDQFPFILTRFHDLHFRLEQLANALRTGEAARRFDAAGLLQILETLKADALKPTTALAENAIPFRVVHNDLKLNNFLFDASTGDGVAVIDLDVIQPGSPVYDFGDLLRIAAMTTAEDATDQEPEVSIDFIKGLTAGFASFLRDRLTKTEVSLLSFGPTALATTIGVRFLTDFLSGDRYFKVEHPQQNLDRARAQFKAASCFRQLQPELQREINKCFNQ